MLRASSPIRRRKSLVLLAYLALQDRPRSRNYLATLFWGDRDDDRARQSLRQDFRSIRPESARILLLEGSAHVLGTFPERLQQKARESLERLGVEVRTSAIVTSVDAGHLKPHPAVFELAMRAGGAPAERCVVIGNKEDNDIEPALALGMRAIFVYPDDPTPTSSKADAVAPDLWACANSLKAMLGAT